MSRLLCLTELLRRPARQAQSRPVTPPVSSRHSPGADPAYRKLPGPRFRHVLPAAQPLLAYWAVDQNFILAVTLAAQAQPPRAMALPICHQNLRACRFGDASGVDFGYCTLPLWARLRSAATRAGGGYA